MATVIEKCRISPDKMVNCEFSLPAVIFDLLWYDGATRMALFYEIPSCSKSNCIESIIPDLKKSLSLTLNNFLPIAGNIIHPLLSGERPILRYLPGNAVSFTVSESDLDLNQLSPRGTYPQFSDHVYPFVPPLPPALTCGDGSYIACPVMAIQVTLFPGQGLSIGLIVHHALIDGGTLAVFLHSWALTFRSKLADNCSPDDVKTLLLAENLLPSYDRKALVENKYLNEDLFSLYWNDIVKRNMSPAKYPCAVDDDKRVRSTFILKKDEIEKLKNIFYDYVGKNFDGNYPVSSFTVTCAFFWVCFAFSDDYDEVADDDELELFGFPIDCRSRLNPPLAANYIGSCVAPIITTVKHGELIKGGINGFVRAVEAIHEVIRERVYGEKGILYRAEDWPKNRNMPLKRQHWIGGSPKFDFYGVDYGWGKMRDIGFFINSDGNIFLNSSRDFKGGIDITLLKTKGKMKVFATVFTRILEDMLNYPNGGSNIGGVLLGKL